MQLPATRPPVKLNEHEAPHIVVVGGGVAGLILAARFGHLLGRRGLARVSLIDRSCIHVWKPMLNTFAAGTWNIYEQQLQYVAHARSIMSNTYLGSSMPSTDRIRLAPVQAAGEVVAGSGDLEYDATSSWSRPPTQFGCKSRSISRELQS